MHEPYPTLTKARRADRTPVPRMKAHVVMNPRRAWPGLVESLATSSVMFRERSEEGGGPKTVTDSRVALARLVTCVSEETLAGASTCPRLARGLNRKHRTGPLSPGLLPRGCARANDLTERGRCRARGLQAGDGRSPTRATT